MVQIVKPNVRPYLRDAQRNILRPSVNAFACQRLPAANTPAHAFPLLPSNVLDKLKAFVFVVDEHKETKFDIWRLFYVEKKKHLLNEKQIGMNKKKLSLNDVKLFHDSFDVLDFGFDSG